MEHKAHTRLFPNEMHTVGQNIEHKAHPIICLSSEIYTEGQDDEQKRKKNHACIRFRLLGDMHTSGVHNEHTHLNQICLSYEMHTVWQDGCLIDDMHTYLINI